MLSNGHAVYLPALGFGPVLGRLRRSGSLVLPPAAMPSLRRPWLLAEAASRCTPLTPDPRP